MRQGALPLSRVETVRQKARRLAESGRVEVVFRRGDYVASGWVRGDHGTYRLVSDPEGTSCACPAWRRRCSHTLAFERVLYPERRGAGAEAPTPRRHREEKITL